jgi:hypothetical protein
MTILAWERVRRQYCLDFCRCAPGLQTGLYLALDVGFVRSHAELTKPGVDSRRSSGEPPYNVPLD